MRQKEKTEVMFYFGEDTRCEGWIAASTGSAFLDFGPVAVVMRSEVMGEAILAIRHALNVIEGELEAAKEQASE